MVCVWHVPNPCWFQFSCRSRRCPASCAPETSESPPTRRKGSPHSLSRCYPSVPLCRSPFGRRSSLLIKQINMIILLLLMDIAIRLHQATNTARCYSILPQTLTLLGTPRLIYTTTRLYWHWRDLNTFYCLNAKCHHCQELLWPCVTLAANQFLGVPLKSQMILAKVSPLTIVNDHHWQ